MRRLLHQSHRFALNNFWMTELLKCKGISRLAIAITALTASAKHPVAEAAVKQLIKSIHSIHTFYPSNALQVSSGPGQLLKCISF